MSKKIPQNTIRRSYIISLSRSNANSLMNSKLQHIGGKKEEEIREEKIKAYKKTKADDVGDGGDNGDTGKLKLTKVTNHHC